jgi:hypothetical protein
MALAAGPNINNPTMDEERSKAAYDAVQRARQLGGGLERDPERALIDALYKRYAWPPPQDRRGARRRVPDAMREVWRAHPVMPT